MDLEGREGGTGRDGDPRGGYMKFEQVEGSALGIECGFPAGGGWRPRFPESHRRIDIKCPRMYWGLTTTLLLPHYHGYYHLRDFALVVPANNLLNCSSSPFHLNRTMTMPADIACIDPRVPGTVLS